MTERGEGNTDIIEVGPTIHDLPLEVLALIINALSWDDVESRRALTMVSHDFRALLLGDSSAVEYPLSHDRKLWYEIASRELKFDPHFPRRYDPYAARRIFLNPNYPQTREICLMVITEYPKLYNEIRHPPNEDLQVALCQRQPDVIRYMHAPGRRVCWAAVEGDPSIIEFIVAQWGDPGQEVCQLALRGDPELMSMGLVPHEYVTRDLCLEVIQRAPWIMNHIPECFLKDEEIVLEALTQDGLLLEHIPEEQRSAAWCQEAVQSDPMAIRWVPWLRQTPDMRLAVVRRNPQVIVVILQHFPTILPLDEYAALCLEAVQRLPTVLGRLRSLWVGTTLWARLPKETQQQMLYIAFDRDPEGVVKEVIHVLSRHELVAILHHQTGAVVRSPKVYLAIQQEIDDLDSMLNGKMCRLIDPQLLSRRWHRQTIDDVWVEDLLDDWVGFDWII